MPPVGPGVIPSGFAPPISGVPLSGNSVLPDMKTSGMPMIPSVIPPVLPPAGKEFLGFVWYI